MAIGTRPLPPPFVSPPATTEQVNAVRRIQQGSRLGNALWHHFCGPTLRYTRDPGAHSYVVLDCFLLHWVPQ